MKNSGEYTISEAMNTIPERDLVFIAAYNPMAFKSMCIMWTLELELIKTGKLPLHNPVILKDRKPKSWFVRLRYKLQTWLFSRLLKMVSKKQ
tara:strand:+ start:315 stop:590 length:276 start_codon:yes stop_codon:yes gene_type:complete